MTNKSSDDITPHIRVTFTASLVVLLLLGVAILNLPTTPSPYITPSRGLNVYNGPGTIWYPPVASLGTNLRFKVLARSPDGLWFKVQYFNNYIGWVYAPYTILSIDPEKLPVDAGPPKANLVLHNIRFSDALPLICGKTVSISVDIANSGNQATTSSGYINIRDVGRDQFEELKVTSVTTGIFPPIRSGQSINVNDLALTVSSFAGDYHWLYIAISLNGDVPDTNSMDNSREFAYILQGDC